MSEPRIAELLAAAMTEASAAVRAWHREVDARWDRLEQRERVWQLAPSVVAGLDVIREHVMYGSDAVARASEQTGDDALAWRWLGYLEGRTKDLLSGTNAEPVTAESLREYRDAIVPPPARRGRKRSGSHYTPRDITEKVVRRTLEPLLLCVTHNGVGPVSERILSLRVCDPACGGGAFLVETTRQLADALMVAWEREGEVLQPHTELRARRRVAIRCVHGVDRSGPAAAMARLAMWLYTRATDLPMDLYAMTVRQGDALVGLSGDQIRAFHWKAQP